MVEAAEACPAGGELVIEQCAKHAPRIAPAMPAAIHATNATDATNERPPRPGANPRLSYPASPVDNRVSEVVEEDLRRAYRVLAEQEAWNTTVGMVFRWFSFPDRPASAEWFASVPREPLTGEALEAWVALMWVRSGHPVIPEARQLEIAVACLPDEGAPRLVDTREKTSREEQVRAGWAQQKSDRQIADATGISSQQVFRIRRRLQLPAVAVPQPDPYRVKKTTTRGAA